MKESIKEVWKVIPYMIPTSYQHIIILVDGTHLCTCLLLVSHGIICRHYFKLMIENPNALFHTMLMPTRWLQDNAWDNIDSISKEPFIGVSSKQTQNDSNVSKTDFIPRHYDNIQEVQVRQQIQKKMEYGRLMGHFKKALNYSLEDNDQKNLDDILLTYISEKETQLERRNTLRENINLDNEIKLADGRVYDVDDIRDPLKRQGKGRPTTKRLKSCNEEKVKAGSSKIQKENVYDEGLESVNDKNKRKCGMCHKSGHYAPKCPNNK